MSDTSTHDSLFARWALRLCALWLAAGAYAKLVYGNPTLLPEVIRNHTPLTWSLTYTLVIGVEFALVSLCFLRARLAWPLMLALFAFFEFVLTTQIAAGAESCGCFGKGLEVSPKLMVAVDSALLLALLASKPWIAIRSRGAGIGIVLIASLIAFAVPAVWIHNRQSESPPPPAPNGTKSAPPESVKRPDWLEVHPETWVGKSVYDIEELTKFVAAEKLPTDGQLILWRQGCTHCAKHLREVANGDKGDHPIVLVQIQDDPKDSRAVDAMPNGAHVTQLEYPAGLQVTVTTPWDFTIVGGTVISALDPKTLDPDEH